MRIGVSVEFCVILPVVCVVLRSFARRVLVPWCSWLMACGRRIIRSIAAKNKNKCSKYSKCYKCFKKFKSKVQTCIKTLDKIQIYSFAFEKNVQERSKKSKNVRNQNAQKCSQISLTSKIKTRYRARSPQPATRSPQPAARARSPSQCGHKTHSEHLFRSFTSC